MRLFNDGPAGTYQETQLQAGDTIVIESSTGCIAFARHGFTLYIWDGTQHNSYENKWPIHPNTNCIGDEEAHALASLIAALSGLRCHSAESTDTLVLFRLDKQTESPPARLG